MYIAIYSVVIALFCGGVVAFFILKNKKDKKRHDQLRESVKVEMDSVEMTASAPLDEIVQPVVEKQEEVEKNDAKLEDFALDGVEQVEKKKELKPLKLNPFETAEELAEAEEIDDDDYEIDDQFAEYEEFLKKSMQMEEEIPDDEDEKKHEEEISNFDLNQLKGKSDVEIAEILKKLPPKMQEIIMTNILGRKEFEDED